MDKFNVDIEKPDRLIRLAQFYGAHSLEDLLRAMEIHVERLRAEVKQYRPDYPYYSWTNPRKG